MKKPCTSIRAQFTPLWSAWSRGLAGSNAVNCDAAVWREATDPLTFAGVAAILTSVTLAACYIPAPQRRDYARNDFDRTHTFVQSIVYDLPFGKGKRLVSSGVGAAILGDWRVSTFLTIMSGLPLYFTASSSPLLAPNNTQTPNLVAPVQILHGVGLSNPWFTTSSFADPTKDPVTQIVPFGNVGRHYLSGPNFFDLDAALSKSIRFTERYNLDLRLEAFGVTNTPQFFFAANGGTAAGTTLGSTSFGRITSATGGRTLQLGAKLTF